MLVRQRRVLEDRKHLPDRQQASKHSQDQSTSWSQSVPTICQIQGVLYCCKVATILVVRSVGPGRPAGGQIYRIFGGLAGRRPDSFVPWGRPAGGLIGVTPFGGRFGRFVRAKLVTSRGFLGFSRD